MSKLTRRALLFGSLGAAAGVITLKDEIAMAIGRVAGACDTPEVDAQTAQKYPSSQARFPDTAYNEIYGDRQYTLIGDSNHTDKRIYNHFFSDRNIGLMAQAGIKNVCLERDQAKQPLIDQLQSGEITPEEFAAEYFPKDVDLEANPRLAQRRELFTQALVKMADLRIKVHLVDTLNQDLEDAGEQGFNAYDEMTQMYEDMCDSDLPMTEGATITYALSNLWDLLNSRGSARDLSLERRDDRVRAEIIKERCGDELSVVMFGSDHFSRSHIGIKALETAPRQAPAPERKPTR